MIIEKDPSQGKTALIINEMNLKKRIEMAVMLPKKMMNIISENYKLNKYR